MAQAKATRRKLLDFALNFPEAWLDHPWGEDVAKVGKKVFVFFGHEGDPEYTPGMSVKLGESRFEALGVPTAEPTGYGLGKAGWVSVQFSAGSPPLGVLQDWIDESYRLVAPKKLVARLDEQSSSR